MMRILHTMLRVGDLDQSLRTRTLDRFRAGELKILVASDVAEIFARSRPGRRDDEAAVVSAVFDNGVLGSAVFSERTAEDIEFEICGAAGRLRVSCVRAVACESSQIVNSHHGNSKPGLL